LNRGGANRRKEKRKRGEKKGEGRVGPEQRVKAIRGIKKPTKQGKKQPSQHRRGGTRGKRRLRKIDTGSTGQRAARFGVAPKKNKGSGSVEKLGKTCPKQGPNG